MNPLSLEKVNTGEDKKEERLVRRLTAAYLFSVLVFLPLAVNDGYYDITETKTIVFVLLSILYLVGRVICVLQFWERGGEPVFPKDAAIFFCAGFCLITLLSSLASGFFRNSFIGPAGRYQGTGMMLFYAGIFFAFRGVRISHKQILLPLSVGLGASAVLTVLNHLGLDPLRMMVSLSDHDRGRYISTLGNINFAGAYFSLTIPVAAWFLLREERWGVRVILGIVYVLGLWGAMAVRSESALLGLGAALLFMPFTLRREEKALSRWGLLLTGTAAAMQGYALLTRCSGGWLSSLTSVAARPLPSAAAAAAGIGWFLLSCRTKKKNVLLRAYGGLLAVLFVLGASGILLLNTLWREVPLGAAEQWLRFSDAWGTDRVMVWRHCLGFFADFPLPDKLIGGGCGILALLDGANRIFPDAVLDAAHCEYLQILLNWGWLGLLTYLGWIVSAAVKAFGKGEPLSMALLAGLTGYAVQAGVNIAQAPGITLFFVLLSSLDLSSRPDEVEEDD